MTTHIVFLRELEYYDGILILTTNRVGIFDEAFTSRFQLALLYPKLNEMQRLQIWRNFIGMLRCKTLELADVEDLERHLAKLARIDINGRQIRNVITMARHLAKFKGEITRYEHVQTAVESLQEFNKYLKAVKGGVSDDEIARESQLRA